MFLKEHVEQQMFLKENHFLMGSRILYMQSLLSTWRWWWWWFLIRNDSWLMTMSKRNLIIWNFFDPSKGDFFYHVNKFSLLSYHKLMLRGYWENCHKCPVEENYFRIRVAIIAKYKILFFKKSLEINNYIYLLQ